MTTEWIRFGVSAALMAAGLIMIIIAVLGVFRFHYALNRMHASAIVDSVGVLLTCASAIVAFGFGWASLKIIVVILFIWLTSPVAAHLVSRIEISTCLDRESHMSVRREGGEPDEEREDK